MDKEAFAKLPKWKRDNKKKDAGCLCCFCMSPPCLYSCLDIGLSFAVVWHIHQAVTLEVEV